MGWLEERYQEFVDEQRDRKSVLEHAEAIYEGLWEEIVLVTTSPTVAFMQIETNGLPRHRTVTMGKRVLKIDLSEDKHSIVATLPEDTEVQLSIAVCLDGVVCLKCTGKTVNYAEAAQRILEPFIFGGHSPYATMKRT